MNSEARKEQERRRTLLAEPARKALVELTGERFNRADKWAQGWKKNTAKFRIKN